MILSNSHIQIKVSTHGAELTSLLVDDQELLWQANPKYWKRHAPILFPIVGKVFQNTYRVNGKEYHLPQHGFARDSEFTLLNCSPNEIVLELDSSDETLMKYPFPFQLQARYTLSDNQLRCAWKVSNPNKTPLYYQIGAHPAFNLPDFDSNNHIHGYLRLFYNNTALDKIEITRLSTNGHATNETQTMQLHNNLLPITPTLFEHDALVLQDSQTDRVELLDRHGNVYLSMEYDAPVLGIWSPLNAPFCCIEPWYGRTDADGFTGAIEERQFIQRLEPEESFTFQYLITATKA